MNFFHRINQYLLERYPNVWNTRLVWMLLIALGLHILFFTGGYFTFISPASLHHQLYDFDVLNGNGVMLFAIAVTIILLVLWLVYLFKNNAFKNFYPTSRVKIFLSFFYYLLIIFACSTFHISYMIGYKTFINQKYPVAKFEAQRLTAAKAAPFLLLNIDDYELGNRRYPSPFDTLQRRTSTEAETMLDGPSIAAHDKWVQFYTTKEVITTTAAPDYEQLIQKSLNYQKQADNYTEEKPAQNNDTVIITILDKVFDLSHLADTMYTIFNYSNNYFLKDVNSIAELPVSGLPPEPQDREQLVLKETYELLTREDAAGIKTRLGNFMKLADEFMIKSNISVDQWFTLVNQPGRYRVDSIINSYPSYNYDEYYDSAVATAVAVDTIAIDAAIADVAGTREIRRGTRYFIDVISFRSVFDNVDELRGWRKLSDFLHVSIWIAFGFASVLLAFRITDLKSVIFAAVAAGLLGILVALFALVGGLSNANLEFSVPYFLLMLAMAIFIIPALSGQGMSKRVKSVFMNLTIVFIVPFVLLILGIISTHQNKYFIAKYGIDYRLKDHQTVMDLLGENVSWLLLAFGLIFIFLYAQRMKRWKALEEG
ncbi:MAG: hypothetical protein EOP54_02660 [Sphingobacteriales bacterium]|nr:MAG: hypothetical protein EOP54_02660 [Sphingobacteriales bacterium]